ncbi:MAG: hypothetical protein P1U57_01515 [Oleibacter sp.]|nr:hypothetical protein [Thalassolituus sp.]
MAEEEHELSEQQRLSLIERMVKLNRKVVIALLIVAVIAVSVASTMGALKFFGKDVVYAEANDVEAMRGELAQLKQEVQLYREVLDQQKKILDTSNATAFKVILLEQEQSYQTHLSALKQGMRDLSKMMPGSRTWLEMYDEQMNLALQESRDRVLQLSALQTSELNARKR